MNSKISSLLFIFVAFSHIISAQKIFHEGEYRSRDGDQAFIDTNEFDYIRLISFEYNNLIYNKKTFNIREFSTYEFKNDDIKIKEIKNFDFKKMELDYDYLREMVKIKNDSIINSLLAIVNNEIPKGELTGSALCYEPRNAIIFYNKKNEITAVLEICFTCGNSISLKKNNNFIGIMAGGLIALKKLFNENGILYTREER